MMIRVWWLSAAVAGSLLVGSIHTNGGEKTPAPPRVVGHRGLFKHSPENTLSTFAACIELRLGFELDIRRSKDGVLICVHDESLNRTTNGKGRVADFTLAELRKLDAGGWFDRRFAGARIPTLEEVFALLRSRGVVELLIALDIKVEDETIAEEVVALAKKYGVLRQVVCIGLTITDAKLRARLRQADAATPIAVLAQKAEDLPAALAAKNADWIYVRFLPTREETARIHALGKKVFVVGTLVAGNEPDNWRRVRESRADALLTDYPLACEQLYRTEKK